MDCLISVVVAEERSINTTAAPSRHLVSSRFYRNDPRSNHDASGKLFVGMNPITVSVELAIG